MFTYCENNRFLNKLIMIKMLVILCNRGWLYCHSHARIVNQQWTRNMNFSFVHRKYKFCACDAKIVLFQNQEKVSTQSTTCFLLTFILSIIAFSSSWTTLSSGWLQLTSRDKLVAMVTYLSTLEKRNTWRFVPSSFRVK